MSEAIAGRVFVSIDGKRLALGETVTIIPGDIEREMKVGADDIHGYKEKKVPPAIEVEGVNVKEASVKDLQKITNSTVVAELINGKVYTLRNAAYMSRSELDAMEGTYTVRFEGHEMDEDNGAVTNG